MQVTAWNMLLVALQLMEIVRILQQRNEKMLNALEQGTAKKPLLNAQVMMPRVPPIAPRTVMTTPNEMQK